MATARLDYIAPWWTYWLHNFPHFNFTFQPVDNTFRPGEASYHQSLVFLACISAAGLVLSLLLLSVYLTSVCCCRKEEEEETKRPDSCCVSWTAVITGLILCSAVGVGFYGNSQTNDGVYQLTYSLHNANHTLGGLNSLVSSSLGSMEVGLQQHLNRLDEIFAARGDYVQALRFMGQMADNIIRQLTAMPDLSKAKVDLSAIADQTDYVEYYRWLTYLLLLILDLVICLVACLGVIWTVSIMTHFMTYFHSCFHTTLTLQFVRVCMWCVCVCVCACQSLTIFQRSLTTMQIQIQGLLQFSVPVFPTAERDLLGIQRLLNSTEFNLNQLTALLDCRGLHKNYLDGLMGVCYDGVEGLLYLCLFSLLSVSAFCAMLCAIPRAWTLITSRDRAYDDIDEEDPFNPQARHMTFNPSRASHVQSFCSYSSSLDSQASPHPPPQTAAILPTSEYMNQSMLFGGNPRYENVPLIGRGSPPPSVRWPLTLEARSLV
uniref:Protein tweety homolog n=1 Tax=Oncorhynchus mykiss TaxID=8022 RepID=A0A8K9X516_ONCMY